MFDIGWTELIVVAVVMILVVGPKDLPKMLRTFGQTIGKVRRMAGEFQSTFNEALREAEQQADIADMKKQVEKAGNFDPLGDIKKSIETDRKAKPAESTPATAKAAPGAASEADAPSVASTPAPEVATPAPAATTAEASQPAKTDQPAKAGESGTANTAGDRTA